MRILKRSTREQPKLSLILLDWSVRESFHLLHYLRNQTVPRDAFEVIVVEYYDRVSKAVKEFEAEIDTWILLEMPRDCYYHKHLMYNAGTVFSRGEILMFGDSDAMVRPSFLATIFKAFEQDPFLVYHMDQFRNVRRDLYPFPYPSFEEVVGEGCINNVGGKTQGILDQIDPMHTRNYGACMCARRNDVIAIGGADEDLTFLGHICGPYEMSFRLMNCSRRLTWETEEYLYHTWHPGSDGIDNYFGPHDGRHMSTTAFQALRTGRIRPLVENLAIRMLRTGSAVAPDALADFLIDETYRAKFERSRLHAPGERPHPAPDVQNPPYASFRGFDVYRHNGLFYAIPQQAGRWNLENLESCADLIKGSTFDDVLKALDALEARFVETAGASNIYQMESRFAIVPHELGPVDLRLRVHRDDPRIAWAHSLPEARRTRPGDTTEGDNSALKPAPAVERNQRIQAASTKFSLIIPTRHRTEQLRRMLDSIRATTKNISELEVVLVMDEDDLESAAFEYDGLTLRRVRLPPGLSMGALNMAGYKVATGSYLMMLNDDVILRTRDWDEQVLAAFCSCPDRMVLIHVNDLTFRDKLCIFPCLTREFCELSGGICEEGYRRYRIDDHIHNVFDLLSLLGHHRRIFLPDVIFEHTNVKTSETGEVHYSPDPVIHQADTRLFDSLLAERKRIAAEVWCRIEGRDDAAERRSLEAKLAPVTDSIAIRRPEHARWLGAAAPATSSGAPRVTIGIVSANSTSAHARECLSRVNTYTNNYELVLIDNNRDPQFNHSREMNRLLSICRTEYLVLMDDDVFVGPGWLEGMLRCVTAGVGVVTPLHRDRHGNLSYAGIVLRPDESGHHTHIMEAPDVPRRVQTVCSAAMLIHMSACGHLRLDERYSKYFLDIDYGLQVWEAGRQVVCSPYSEVTHLAGATIEQGGPRSSQLFEEQRQRYVQSWVDSGRIRALRQNVWPAIPEIAWIDRTSERLNQLLQQPPGDRAQFMHDATTTVKSLTAYPALKDYIGDRARNRIGYGHVRVDDPATGHLAFVLGLTGRQPVLFEEDFEGMNIVLQSSTYYALPQAEGGFSYERMIQNGYSRSFEADSPEKLKALILKHRDRRVRGHVKDLKPALPERSERPAPSPPNMRRNPLTHYIGIGAARFRRLHKKGS